MTGMDREIIIQSEVSQTEKDKIYVTTYMYTLKKLYKWTHLQNRYRGTILENKLMFTKRGALGEG